MLLVIIVLELFVHVEDLRILFWIHLADGLVIAVFVIDFILLAIHAQNAKQFLKKSWLDILAVFPFNLVFSLAERLFRAVAGAEQIVVGQAIAHEGLEARKLAGEAVKGERLAKLSRFVRIGARMTRIFSKSKSLHLKSSKLKSSKLKSFKKKKPSRP
ncbi:hypothetical protein HYX14_02040 [Candidatus Woesearchaeota archaeon]|nr:hypothetical protein [Candidatus Woesearchaeota archaeon]